MPRPFFHFQDAEFFGLLFEAGLNGCGNLLFELVLLIHSEKYSIDLIVTEVAAFAVHSRGAPSYAMREKKSDARRAR